MQISTRGVVTSTYLSGQTHNEMKTLLFVCLLTDQVPLARGEEERGRVSGDLGGRGHWHRRRVLHERPAGAAQGRKRQPLRQGRVSSPLLSPIQLLQGTFLRTTLLG